MCVEGDSEGPLTGSDRDGKWIWDECIASSSSTGGATGGATGSADDEAAAAMKDSEASVEKLNKGEEAAIKEEKKMAGDEKKAFNVIKHLKAVIAAWKGRKAEISEAEEKIANCLKPLSTPCKRDAKPILKNYWIPTTTWN